MQALLSHYPVASELSFVVAEAEAATNDQRHSRPAEWAEQTGLMIWDPVEATACQHVMKEFAAPGLEQQRSLSGQLPGRLAAFANPFASSASTTEFSHVREVAASSAFPRSAVDFPEQLEQTAGLLVAVAADQCRLTLYAKGHSKQQSQFYKNSRPNNFGTHPGKPSHVKCPPQRETKCRKETCRKIGQQNQ